jgi:hypothetical protein
MTYREMTRQVMTQLGGPTEGPEFDQVVQDLVFDSGIPANTELPDENAKKRIFWMVKIARRAAKDSEYAARADAKALELIVEQKKNN